MSRREGVEPETSATGLSAYDRLVGFLEARLTEELAAVWERSGSEEPGRPGMAAQVAVLDELLTTVRSGLLPCRRELRLLLFAYGVHPDYEPGWTGLLMGRAG